MQNISDKFFNIRRNFLGIICFGYIFFVFVISVFAYVLAPDNSSNANTMNLSIHSKKPGFKTEMINLKEEKSKKISLRSIFLVQKNRSIKFQLSNMKLRMG